MSHIIEEYGPTLASVLEENRHFAFDAGMANHKMFETLQGLTITSAFDPTQVTEPSMAKLCLSGVWLFHDFLEESHAISQNIDNPSGSFWHGIMHRREGDYSNAKYWFRSVGEHEVFDTIDEKINECEKLFRTERLTNLAEAGYDPFELVDHCRAVAEAFPDDESTNHLDAAAQRELRVFCEEVTRLEWWALFDYCYQKATH